MASRVGRWGGSISVRLPKNVAAGAGLAAGDEVEVRLLDNGDVRVRPVKEPVPASSDHGLPSQTAVREPLRW